MGFPKLPDELVVEILSLAVTAWVTDEAAGWEEMVNGMLVCGKWNLTLRRIIIRSAPVEPLLRRCKSVPIMQESLNAYLKVIPDQSLLPGKDIMRQLLILASVVISRQLPTLLAPLLRAGVPGGAKTVGEVSSTRSRRRHERRLQRIRCGEQKDVPLIHYAVASGSIECLDLLCEAGADIDQWCRAIDESPLGLAVTTNQCSMVAALIGHGAQTDVYSTIYRAGHAIKRELIYGAAEKRNSALVRLLVECGSHHVRFRSVPTDRALTRCVLTWGDAAIFQHLSAHGLVNKYGDAIELAISSGDIEMVRTCLDGGINPNEEVIPVGKFPLTIALEKNRADIVELLLAKGAVAR